MIFGLGQIYGGTGAAVGHNAFSDVLRFAVIASQKRPEWR